MPEPTTDPNPQATRGIPKAASGTALGILQNEPKGGGGSHLAAAAFDVASYHTSSHEQLRNYEALTRALADFLTAIVTNAPPGPERSTAISRAREAGFWAKSGIAMEGR